MFKKLFGAAFAAGIVAGLLITGIQQVTTTPLILHAEEYENGGHDHAASLKSDYVIIQTKLFSTRPSAGSETLFLAHSNSGTEGHDDDDDASAPEDGLERTRKGSPVIATILARKEVAAQNQAGKQLDALRKHVEQAHRIQMHLSLRHI